MPKESCKGIRIVIVSSHPPWRKGGVETYNYHILSSTKKRMHSINLYLLTYIPGRLKRLLSVRSNMLLWIKVPSILLFNIMLSHNFIGELNTLLKKVLYVLLHMFYLTKGLVRYLPILRSCHVIVSNGALVEMVPVFILAKILKKRFFILWRTGFDEFMKNFAIRALLRVAFREACGVMVNDKELAIYAKMLGSRSVYIRVQDVDTDLFRPQDVQKIRKELRIPMHSFVALFAAPLNKTKMADVFLEAIEQILDVDTSFLFIIIGEGPLETKVIELKRRYPSNILFINRFISREELNKYFNASDIVYGYAGTYYPGRIVLEALSAGRPVLILNKSLHSGGKLKFRIPLPNVFIVEPSSKDLAEFLLRNKNIVLHLSRDRETILKSRYYVVKNHSLEKQLMRDLWLILKATFNSPRRCE